MPNLVDFLIVGRTPLGGALRAGLIGVLATTVGTWFFIGSWGPLVVGAIIVVIVIPLAYAFSRRDDPPLPPRAPGPDHGPTVPSIDS